MSEEKETRGVPLLYPTEKVEYCWWNMNTMGPEEFGALKEDMRAKGPYGINPILAAHGFPTGAQVPEGVLICVDGNQRLKAARELKWPQIRVEIDEGIKLEEDARAISYHKNRERGHIDEFKEAQNFQWLKEQGWTQERIAKEYHVDKSQVSKRLSLLEVVPAVKRELQELPRVKVTASHFEPIATLEPKLQVKAAKEIKEKARRQAMDDGTLTARAVEKIAKEVREEDEQERELKAQIEKYEKEKHTRCPTCKSEPARKDGRGFPWVVCRNYHSWNLKTGMTEREEWAEKYPEAAKVVEKKPQKAPFPNYLRTTYTLDQFKAAFSNYIVEALRDLKSVKNVDVEGLNKDGNRVTLSYDVTTIGVHLGHNDLHLNVEEKKYEAEKLKEFKTVVTTWPEITNKARAKEAKENVGKIMDEYGERPKRKRGPKPGRKRTKRSKRGKRTKRGEKL